MMRGKAVPSSQGALCSSLGPLAEAGLIALIVLLLLAETVMCLVPPVSRDALVHHLAVPKLYLKYGGIREIPYLPFSYYPANLDLLYMIPLALGNDILPKFLHAAFALATALLLYIYLNPRSGRTYALFGALLFLSTPLIVRLSTTAYVDLGLIFFTTASILALFRWRRRGYRTGLLLLAGLLAGLSAGTKYNGLLAVGILSLLVPVLFLRGRPGASGLKALGCGVAFFMSAMVAFSPWMIRNLMWKNNPVYPLLDKWIHPMPSSAPPAFVPDPFTVRRVLFGEGPVEVALLPFRLFFEGQDDSHRYFDGRLNPFLLLLPLLAFTRNKEDDRGLPLEKGILGVYSLVYILAALNLEIARVRYLAPMVPCLAILAAMGLKNLTRLLQRGPGRRHPWAACLMAGLVACVPLALNAGYAVERFSKVKPLRYLLGDLSREAYIARAWPEYPLWRFINTQLPPDAVVSFLFMGKRGYYCDRPYLVEQQNVLDRLTRTSLTPRDVWEGVRKTGATHLLAHLRLLEYWLNTAFEGEERDRLAAFFQRYTVVMKVQNGFGLYLLKKE